MNPETLISPPETICPAEGPAGALIFLRKELIEQKDLYLRLAAELENFKRRYRHDSEARAAAQKEAFMLELLPVIDNLERALASGASRGSRQLYQGVEMTLQQLRLVLRQHGIEADESAGQTFDPHFHEAVSQRSDSAFPDHSILEVFQRGYRHGKKVLRAAKVVVNDITHSELTRHAR